MMHYKLVSQQLQTYGGFQWRLGKWVEASGPPDRELCTDSWLHCYDSPLLAALHNPIHANVQNPRLFEVEGSGGTKDDKGMKRGFRKMRLVKEIPVPTVTQKQRVAYGILCAKMVYTAPAFVLWADGWLLGEDRSEAPARAAAEAIARTVVRAAVQAAEAAAWAAEAAARAAVQAAAEAEATEAVAWAAARAAQAGAVEGNKPINLIELAKQAMNDWVETTP